MNSYKKAKYSVMNTNHGGAYFELPVQYRKRTDIVKICIMKFKNNVRHIASIYLEYLNYHDITEQGSLEIIIMLKHILNDEQKRVINFSLYEEVLNTIARTNDFGELLKKYNNKTVLNYLIDKHIELLLRAFKINTSTRDTFMFDLLNHYDPELAEYLSNHENIINKYIEPNKKKLSI